jgi:hypothetical protein
MRKNSNDSCWKCKGTKIIPSNIDSQEDATCTICMGEWCNKCLPPLYWCECDTEERHNGEICCDSVARQCDVCLNLEFEINLSTVND